MYLTKFECMKKINFIKPLLLSVWSISIVGCNNAATNDKESQNIKTTTESIVHNNISADSLVYVVNDIKLPFEIYSALDKDKMENITVIKDSTAIQKYWEKGKKGVLYITLKNKIREENTEIYAREKHSKNCVCRVRNEQKAIGKIRII